MDVIEIMRDAMSYPLANVKNWLVIALLFLINGILQQLAINYRNAYLTAIVGVISVIVLIVISGVFISIMRETFDNSSEIPMLNPIVNLVDGIKYLITQIIYFLIPTVITLILAFPVTGSKVNQLLMVTSQLAANTTNTTQIVNAIPQSLLIDVFVSIGIVAIFALILYIIFGLLSNIAIARLAETDDITAALNIPYIIKKIQSIGIGKYVYFIVLVFLVSFVFSLVSGLISAIPYVGIIIASFIVQSFAIVFIARATALIYMEG